VSVICAQAVGRRLDQTLPSSQQLFAGKHAGNSFQALIALLSGHCGEVDPDEKAKQSACAYRIHDQKRSNCCRRTTTLVAEDMARLQQWFDWVRRPSSHYVGFAKLEMWSVIAENKTRVCQGGVTFSAAPLRNRACP